MSDGKPCGDEQSSHHCNCPCLARLAWRKPKRQEEDAKASTLVFTCVAMDAPDEPAPHTEPCEA